MKHSLFTLITLSIACSLYGMSTTYAHDWVNHIQTRLSDKQIKQDVKSMHAAGMTVQQTIEGALREQHTQILNKIKRQLCVPDDVWQKTMDDVETKKQELLDSLYSKENLFNNNWFISENDLAKIKNPDERNLWNQLRIVAKNTLIDFGINPKNIYIYSNDAGHLNYLQELIDKESSWWQRQKMKLVKGMNTWNYALSPVWCACSNLGEKPRAEIAFNISSMTYFEPIEQRGLFGHEVTHLIEGHIQEQDAIAALEEKYSKIGLGKISSKTIRSYFHNRELMADQLPALRNIITAEKCYDAMFTMGVHWPVTSTMLHPLIDSIAPTFSTHPLTIYRRQH